ncbi:DUF4062 domain-containing protein [Jiangella mangrovi]|uniref:DUF4062 domain-containing protein n=1 Tax=Jiangella mangrovi TaxID=1524084 RepID=A0A7W9GS75_9ACTN|nr:DUF4062 domain-containing protein [Jiangella mangrovi]MBB5788751.1 hypothetical protein [Jiangella mangrovi]
MTFPAVAIVVLIASPGDTGPERSTVALELGRWNALRAQHEHVVVVPWLYEHHAVPLLGAHPQSIINAQAVDRADAVVAIFEARLGTATAAAISGTAEEIQRAVAAGKPVHVYFSREAVPVGDIDPQQLASLKAFREGLQSQGLLGEYESPKDLAAQVRAAIEHDIATQRWGVEAGPIPAARNGGALLVAHHDHRREPRGIDNRGKQLYRTISNRLVVTNKSTTTAADELMVRVEGLNGQEAAVRFDEPKEPITLGPGSERSWTLIAFSRDDVRVLLTWTEDGQPMHAEQTIRLSSG